MAVSKQTQVNTFNDGMQKDLNPLLTPNTVMTDCLNGTILTYNGNEFALQNDMGNYKFEKGKLSEKFVPIGIKEHANVLYIVSYNPIEDKVEIGSFPSMKTIEESALGSYEVDSQTITLESNVNLYTDLASKSKLITLSEIKDDFKLNPGDEYRLVDPVDDDIWKFTSKYIFTENSKLYNIDDYIKTVKSEDDVFSNVTWDVPGWIAIKEIVNTMSEFSAYVDECVHRITISSDGRQIDTKDLVIDIQTIWDGKHYSNSYLKEGEGNTTIIEAIKTRLKWAYVCHNGNYSFNKERFGDLSTSDNKTFILSPNKIYNNLYSSLSLSTDKEFITIVPYLDIDNKGTIIIYDQFLTTLKLEKKEFDQNSIVVADQVFKYEIDEVSNKVNFTFDCYNAENSCLYYNFTRTDDQYVFANWQMADIEPGSVTLSFDVDFYYQGDNRVYKNSNYFDSEDVYTLHLLFLPEDYKIEGLDLPNNIYTIKKTVILSKFMDYWNNKCDNYSNLDNSEVLDALYDFINKNITCEFEFDGSSRKVYYKNDYEEKSMYGWEISNIFRNNIGNKNVTQSDGNLIFKIYSGEKYDIDVNLSVPKNNRNVDGRLWADSKNEIINANIDKDSTCDIKRNNGIWSLHNLESIEITSNTDEISVEDYREYHKLCPNNWINNDGSINIKDVYYLIKLKEQGNSKNGGHGGLRKNLSSKNFRVVYNSSWDEDNDWEYKFFYNDNKYVELHFDKAANRWSSNNEPDRWGSILRYQLFNSYPLSGWSKSACEEWVAWGDGTEKKDGSAEMNGSVNKSLQTPVFVNYYNNLKNDNFTKYINLQVDGIDVREGVYLQHFDGSFRFDQREWCGILFHNSNSNCPVLYSMSPNNMPKGETDGSYIAEQSLASYLASLAVVDIPKSIVNTSLYCHYFNDVEKKPASVGNSYVVVKTTLNDYAKKVFGIENSISNNVDIIFNNQIADERKISSENENELNILVDKFNLRTANQKEAYYNFTPYANSAVIKRDLMSPSKEFMYKFISNIELKDGKVTLKKVSGNSWISLRSGDNPYHVVSHISESFIDD